MPGDYGHLHSLQVTLAGLNRAPEAIASEASHAIGDLVQREYAEGRAPNGDAWAPLKASTLARGRRPPALTDKGAMSGGTRCYPLGSRVIVEVPFPGPIHQWSRRPTLARRPIVPDVRLPQEWRTVVVESANRELKKLKR